MSSSSFARELDVAQRLALSAGELILEHRAAGVTVEHKAGDEPVTRADREASELILAGLARAFPDDVTISEEGADDPRRTDASQRVWFIDPLDGTRDFVAGRDGFAVMIGLCQGARPCLGVVYQPLGARLYFAARGAGAHLTMGGATRPIACSPLRDPTGIRMVSSRSHRSEELEEVRARLGIADELQIGSVGIKLGLIALGERELYVNPSSRSKLWDTCAPEAILAEAGGRLSTVGGEDLRYDQVELANRAGLVATNGRVHDFVLARLAELGLRPGG